MDRDDYLNRLNRKGAFQRFSWRSEVKPAAAHKERELHKFTTAIARTGISYANMAPNADKETGELPWGQWEEFPYLISHKERLYARLYVLDGSVSTGYYVDGVKVDKDEFDQYLTPSARKSKVNETGTITVKLENLLAK